MMTIMDPTHHLAVLLLAEPCHFRVARHSDSGTAGRSTLWLARVRPLSHSRKSLSHSRERPGRIYSAAGPSQQPLATGMALSRAAASDCKSVQ